MSRKLKINSIYAVVLNNHSLVAICLFIDAFLIRFYFLLSSDNIYGQEPMLNITTALHILTNPAFFQNVFYLQLPLFLYSIAAAVKLGSEQIISARFLVVVVSSLSLIPYYYLINKVFNRKIALFSGLLLYSYYAHIIMSIVTMPDTIAIGWIFFSLWMVFSERYLLGAVFCLIACGYSYLAWLLVPVLGICIIFAKQKSLRQQLINGGLFLVIAGLFPLIWNFIVSREYGQDWLWYRNLHNPDSLYTSLFLAGKSMRQIIICLFLKPVSLIFCFSLIGIFFSAKKKNEYPYILCVISLIFLLSLNLLRKEILIIDQGLLLVSALLIPYLVQGLFFSLKKIRIKSNAFKLLIIIIISIASLIIGFYQRPKVPFSVKEVSSWLQANVDIDALIYIQPESAGYHSVIVMESGLPQLNFCNLPQDWTNIAQSDKQQYLVLPVSAQLDIDFKEWKKFEALKGYLIFQRK